MHIAAGPDAETIDDCQHPENRHRQELLRNPEAGHFPEIAPENNRASRHAAGLHDQQQRPAVKKRDHRMIGIAQVRVLAPDARPQHRELGVNKRTDQRDNSAENPRAEHQRRRMDEARDDGGIHKNARPDDAPHHNHDGVKRPEPARGPWFTGRRVAALIFIHGQ